MSFLIKKLSKLQLYGFLGADEKLLTFFEKKIKKSLTLAITEEYNYIK